MLIIEGSHARQIFLLHFCHDCFELGTLLRRLFWFGSSGFVFCIYVSLQVSVALEYLVETNNTDVAVRAPTVRYILRYDQ